MMDMMKMMGKIKEAQERMKEAQKTLDQMQVSAESGAGMVKATVNGKKKLIQLEIDPSLNDIKVIQDLTVAAVNLAQEKAEMESKMVLQKSTEGLIPNIPGMDLGSILG